MVLVCGAPGHSRTLDLSIQNLLLRQENRRLKTAQSVAQELYEALRLFVADDRFVVTMGGNPTAIEQAIEQAHAAIQKYEERQSASQAVAQ